MKKKIIISTIIAVGICMPLIIKWATNELTTAVDWMYQNGLTKYTSVSAFRSTDTIRRDEASKLFSLFAQTVLGKDWPTQTAACATFTDVASTNTMKTFIIDSCNRWYVLWSAGKFYPTSSLTNIQAISIIMRMLEGKQDESWTHRYDVYFARATELWLLDGLSFSNKSAAIKRGILGILLYRTSQLPDLETYTDTITSSTQPDLILSAVGLNTNYAAPKVGDEHIYVNFTIKNLGTPLHLSSTKKIIFSCSSNSKILEKEISNWFIDTNGTFSMDGITNTIDPKIFLFPAEESNYTVTCSVRLQSSTLHESNENNNSKSFSFVVNPATSGKPDLIIDSLILDPNYSSPKVNDEHVYLKMTIKNTWETMTFTPINQAVINCHNNTNIISTSITWWTLWKNQTMTLSLTNPYDPNIYMFIAPENNYAIHCLILLSSQSTIQESVVNEGNYKSIYFNVGTGSGY